MVRMSESLGPRCIWCMTLPIRKTFPLCTSAPSLAQYLTPTPCTNDLLMPRAATRRRTRSSVASRCTGIAGARQDARPPQCVPLGRFGRSATLGWPLPPLPSPLPSPLTSPLTSSPSSPPCYPPPLLPSPPPLLSLSMLPLPSPSPLLLSAAVRKSSRLRGKSALRAQRRPHKGGIPPCTRMVCGRIQLH